MALKQLTFDKICVLVFRWLLEELVLDMADLQYCWKANNVGSSSFPLKRTNLTSCGKVRIFLSSFLPRVLSYFVLECFFQLQHALNSFALMVELIQHHVIISYSLQHAKHSVVLQNSQLPEVGAPTIWLGMSGACLLGLLIFPVDFL